MHFHVPKPLHGWREFAGEVAIIVIGVLIALFFEEVVQRWNWDNKIRTAEAAMQRETFWDNAPEMVQRASIQPCIDAQLDAIRAAAESGAPRADVAGLIDRLYLPFVTFDTVAEQNATASDVPTHMPKDRVGVWTQAYAMVPMIDATNATEAADAAKIKAMKRTGGPLSLPEQMALLQAVEAVRSDGRRMLAGISWAMAVLPKLHGTVDKERLKMFMDDARMHYGTCARDLPSDWPTTPLRPLPGGLAPGIPVN
ncbi:MAG TPA: hypothetical protein VHS33_00070 [Sphingomicrobium sp.]|jgi:hypothetical protein|nr:hypothetical protein [Sphingomicrobium sp.]